MGLYEDAQAARAARDEQERAVRNAELARKSKEENDLLEFRTTFAKAAQESGYPTSIIGCITYGLRKTGFLGRGPRELFWRFHPLTPGWSLTTAEPSDGYDSYQTFIILPDGRMLYHADRSYVNWVPQENLSPDRVLHDAPASDYVVISIPPSSAVLYSYGSIQELPREATPEEYRQWKDHLLPWLGEAIGGTRS